MRFELPLLTRCCFCVPLRRGVISWAYANLAYQSLLMYINVHILILIIVFVDMVGIGDIILEMFGFLLILSSAVYSILIIVACHKKSAKLLRISYKYGIFDAIFTIIYSMSSLHREIHFVYIRRLFGNSSTRLLIVDMAMLLSGNFLEIVFLCYVILLIRSEMIKLQEQSLEIEFVNNAAAIEARCVITQRNDNDIEAKCVSAQRGADNNSEERCVSADNNSSERCVSVQSSAGDNSEALCESEAQCETKRDSV